jgi:hypothetical protein
LTKRLFSGIGIVALAFFAMAAPAAAQVYTGRIDVTAVDSTGAVLPGVSVEIDGTQKAMAVTDARGEAHFLNLAPGKYTVAAKLTGFRDYMNESVQVGAGAGVSLRATLAVGGVAASETVLAETPILDPKREVVSTSISLDELQKVPSSRDPWVVLQTVPGVIVDRVNVGGAESGQQSNFQAKGASVTDNTWNLDGIPITDMSATGSSPTYYDFDMFSEMQVTTGGADIAMATPGVALNFVLRSGTNSLKGSGRYYWEGHQTQSNNVPSTLAGTITSYNRMKDYKDFGGEAGGALVKNRLFVWGAYGRTEPKLQIFTVDPNNKFGYIQTAKDETQLENYSGKVTGEITPKMRASFTYFRGNKEKFGRGASAKHPDETTWNQTGPTDMYKGELNMSPTNALYVTARYAYVKNSFHLIPRGKDGVQTSLDDAGVFHGNYIDYLTERPSQTVSADGNYFKGAHELKFGFSYRKVDVTSSSVWPGGGLIFISTGYPDYVAQLIRDLNVDASTKYMSGYAADTWSKDRLTVNAGLRWDRQAASLNSVGVPAVPIAPVLLPALSGQAASNVVVLNSVTPRIGLTYALDESRRTLARASYSMFASQLPSNQATVLSTIQYSTIYFSGVDNNRDNQVQASELIGNLATGAGGFGNTGFNLSNPTSLETPNVVGDYKTPITHEVVLGIDRQLTRDIALSGSFTYRRYNNFTWYHLKGVDGTSYTQTGTYNCNAAERAVVGPCSVPTYTLNAGAAPDDGGQIFETRPGYHQRYWGLEFAATKRMSRNWMARAAWSTSDAREYIDSLAAVQDPTPFAGPNAAATNLGPNINGGLVSTQTGGSGKSGIFLVLPKYQFILNSAYQMKWGITTGVNYLFRQGYSQPFYSSATGSGAKAGVVGTLLVNSVDDYRLPSVHSLDFRLGKQIRADRFTVDVDVDAFNLFNLATTLGKEYDLNLSTGGNIIEIMNPRIIRFGARIGF